MSKHSAGPWATEGNDKSWSLLDGQGRRIALIDKGGLNAAENARLITAAPELMELATSFVALMSSPASPVRAKALAGLADTARTVIAKAEGN